jgi:superfamily I DNA/RNA helicase
VDETGAAPDDPGGGNRRPYRSLIPLREILGELLETGAASKKVAALYGALIEKAGSELGLLMNMSIADIEGLKPPGLSGELLAAALERMRSGRVSISPGYDGEYGVIRAFAPGETPPVKFRAELFADEGAGVKPGPSEKRAKSAAGVPDVAVPSPAGSAMRAGTAGTPALIDTGAVPGDSAPGHGAARTKPGPLSFTLNAEQERVVSYGGRQAIVIAGPGTGKTAMLAARISRLVREGIDPRSVLALSFTVKAAAELEERIAAAAGEQAAGVTAATFHSFCLSVLREQAGRNGVPRDFRILGDGEREKILREICAGDRKAGMEKRGKKRIGYQKLGEYIEGRKRCLLLPGEEAPKIGGPKFGGSGFETLIRLAEELGIPEVEPEHERLYGLYRDRLRSSALLDFDDLVAGTVRLLCGNREQLARRRERFRFIFVDEYQDVNFAQYALIRLLTAEGEDVFSGGENQCAGNPPSLWVIGDPNQAIYGFRGSDKRFIERFLVDYPGAGKFHLTQSFRCAVPIINAAGTLINARLRGTEGEVALFRHEYPTEKAEAEGIARRISRLIGGASFFAIDSGVTDNGAGETDTAEIAILIRSAALAPPIIKALRDHGIPFEFTGEKPWWEEEPARAVLDVLREGRHPAGGTPAEAVKSAREFLQKNGTLGAGKKATVPESLERILGLASLYDDLSAFLETLAIRAAGDLPEIQREGVRLMTIHAAKGLEFDQVFIAALEEGLLPFTLYGDQHIDEERRLLYVAMTRARRGLSLSWSRTRVFQGRTLEAGPSRFLAELETLIPLERDYQARPGDPQMSLF